MLDIPNPRTENPTIEEKTELKNTKVSLSKKTKPIATKEKKTNISSDKGKKPSKNEK